MGGGETSGGGGGGGGGSGANGAGDTVRGLWPTTGASRRDNSTALGEALGAACVMYAAAGGMASGEAARALAGASRRGAAAGDVCAA